jgi:hypothetical protein
MLATSACALAQAMARNCANDRQRRVEARTTAQKHLTLPTSRIGATPPRRYGSTKSEENGLGLQSSMRCSNCLPIRSNNSLAQWDIGDTAASASGGLAEKLNAACLKAKQRNLTIREASPALSNISDAPGRCHAKRRRSLAIRSTYRSPQQSPRITPHDCRPVDTKLPRSRESGLRFDVHAHLHSKLVFSVAPIAAA